MTQAQDLQSARARLAQTRRELLRHMGQHTGHAPTASGADGRTAPPWPEGAQDQECNNSEAAAHGSGWRQGLRAWWRSQPAHLALELGQPVFEKYARAHPLKVLALAAGAGAVLALARPWRLISVTGVLVAALKSAQLSSLASDVLRPPGAAPGGHNGSPPPR